MITQGQLQAIRFAAKSVGEMRIYENLTEVNLDCSVATPSSRWAGQQAWPLELATPVHKRVQNQHPAASRPRPDRLAEDDPLPIRRLNAGAVLHDERDAELHPLVAAARQGTPSEER